MSSKKWPNFCFYRFFLENGDLPFVFHVGIRREQSVNPFGSSSVAGERNTAVQRFFSSSSSFLLFITHTRSLSLSISCSLSLSISFSLTISPFFHSWCHLAHTAGWPRVAVTCPWCSGPCWRLGSCRGESVRIWGSRGWPHVRSHPRSPSRWFGSVWNSAWLHQWFAVKQQSKKTRGQLALRW